MKIGSYFVAGCGIMIVKANLVIGFELIANILLAGLNDGYPLESTDEKTGILEFTTCRLKIQTLYRLEAVLDDIWRL